MDNLGVQEVDPANWLPTIEKYGLGTVALVILAYLLWRNSNENKNFLLGLIANMTTRIRDLEGTDRNKLIETCDKAADAMEKLADATERASIQHARGTELLQQCSTQLTESARLME